MHENFRAALDVALRARLGDAGYEAAVAEGAATPVEQAFEWARKREERLVGAPL